MPFFLKPCLRLRRKNKKGKKEKDIQTISDVITRVTNKEICQQYSNVSETSPNEEVQEINGNASRVTSLRLISAADNSSSNDISKNDTTQNNNQYASSDVNDTCKKPDVMCHVAFVENLNNIDCKENTNSEQLSKNDEVFSRIISGDNIKNSENDIKLSEEACGETSNMIPSAGEPKLDSEKSCEIISGITVSSNVFDAIEELKSDGFSYTDETSLDKNELNKNDDPASATTQRPNYYLENRTDNFVSKDDEGASVTNIRDVANENEKIHDRSSSTGFIASSIKQNSSRDEIFVHKAKSELEENDDCVSVQEGSTSNDEDKSNYANANQEDKNITDDKGEIDSVSSAEMSEVSSKSEYKSLESLNTVQCGYGHLEDLLKSSLNNTETISEVNKNTTKAEFVTEVTDSGDHETEPIEQFLGKDSSEFRDETEDGGDSDVKLVLNKILKKLILKKNNHFSHKVTKSLESTDCAIENSIELKDIANSSFLEASPSANEKESILYTDDELDTDISTILEESTVFVNKNNANKEHFAGAPRKMVPDSIRTMEESNTDSHTDETERIASNFTTDVNIKRKYSNISDINLEIPHQSPLPQQTVEFTEYIHNEYSPACVHNHSKADYEADIYTSMDEYYSDDSKENFVLEDSENERDDDGNLYNLCSFHEEANGLRKSLCEELPRCHKETSNLICFHEDFPINNTVMYCHDDTGIPNDGKYDILCDSNDHVFEKNLGNSMDIISDERFTKVDLMPSKLFDLKGNSEFDTKNNTASFKTGNYIIDGHKSKSDEQFHFKFNRDDKSLNKYRLPSPSGSSELSDSGELSHVNRKKSGSFTISACGDNEIVNDRFFGGIDSSKYSHETSGNKNVLQLNIDTMPKTENHVIQKFSSKLNDNLFPIENIFNMGNDNNFKSIQSTVLKEMFSNETEKLGNTFENKTNVEKLLINEETLKLRNDLKLDNFNEIENCLRQTLEKFKRKKQKALAVMKADLRNVPIKKIHGFKIDCSKVENFTLAKHKCAKRSSMMQEPIEVEKSLEDFLRFPSQQGTNLGDKKSASHQKNKFNADELGNHEACSSDSNVEYSSDNSEKMTYDVKEILKISRTLRSPKYSFKNKKKAPNNTVLYRMRPVIIKPSKLNLVAYVTKDENNVYKIKKGYRVCSPVYRKPNTSERNNRGADFARCQSHHAVIHRATSPGNLKIKFDDQFRRYASRGRPNGELMSYRRSTEWLKDAGLIGKALTTDEANDAFKCVAGVKVALNKGDYRNFLKKLTRLKKLNYNEIYEKLCLAANKYAEG